VLGMPHMAGVGLRERRGAPGPLALEDAIRVVGPSRRRSTTHAA